ncbi:MAG TPA: hypothetical protein VLJ76_00885 [Gaiellaceae bacterium]|nr:hypothetical protein [Gaiellaceae bacterium]
MTRFKISPALVVACLALLVALAGTGVAAVTALPKGSVHTAALANGAVTAAKLANRSVTASKLAANAKVAGPAGPQGLKGDPGGAGPAGPSGVVSAWTGYAYPGANTYSSAGAELAHLTFSSSVSGFAIVTADFAMRIHQAAAADCRVQTQLSPAAGAPDQSSAGFVDEWINGNLPTQYLGGTYLGLNASATRVVPVVNGSNTVYLNGKSDCTAALLGPVTLTAVFSHTNPTSSIVTP